MMPVAPPDRPRGAASLHAARAAVVARPGVRLFRVGGIQLTASWSWLLLLGVMVYAAQSLFAPLLPTAPVVLRWGMAVIATLLFAASLYLHELAHALVAIRFGIHVTTVRLFLLGGLTHIARESPSPRAELLIALAGPFCSLLIGLLGAVVAALTLGTLPPLGTLGVWLALVNLPLAIFNMLPSFPLDGGSVMRAVLWFAGRDLRWASAVCARAGQLGAAVLFFAGAYSLFNGRGSSIAGLWMLLIAWFVFSGATGAHRTILFADVLGALSVASVMERRFGRVAADLPLQALARDYLAPDGQWRPHAPPSFAVYREDALIGLVRLHDLSRVPAGERESTVVEQVMMPVAELPALLPHEPALHAMRLLAQQGVEQLPVMVESRLLGLVSHADLARAVHSRS